MHRLWIVGSLLVVGCAARVTNQLPPVAATTQQIVVVPVDESPTHPHGQPPGQDPTFIPPGHGGVPPGQAKKADALALDGVTAMGEAPVTNADDNGNGDKDKPKSNAKGKKAKGKATEKK
jgi:hypothetical protein